MSIRTIFAPDFARYEGVRMLPIMLFTVSYKALWLLIVAYPLWRAGTLAGSPEEPMTRVFIWTPLLMLAIPWGYVFRHYVMWPRKQLLPEGSRQGMASIR